MLFDKNQEERLNSLYNVDYNLHSEDSPAKKKGEEIDSLIKREKEFMEKWQKYLEEQQAEGSTFSPNQPWSFEFCYD